MKKTKETKLQELERRIARLEKDRVVIIPVSPSFPNNTFPSVPVHYHNGCPCYDNPCIR